MKITPIKTHKIKSATETLFDVVDQYVPNFADTSILVVTSKIVSICQGCVVPVGEVTKEELVAQEADYYIPSTENKYNTTISIKDNVLVSSAGIDQSNGDGHYILRPSDPQKTANSLREHLIERFKLKRIGVIITDSVSTPLRRGATGVAIAHSGFAALKNYKGTLDIFGRPLKVTKANIVDGLASAAVLIMGEGNEQTPLAIIEDAPFVDFQPRNPTPAELSESRISMEDDLFASVWQPNIWRKGKQ